MQERRLKKRSGFRPKIGPLNQSYGPLDRVRQKKRTKLFLYISAWTTDYAPFSHIPTEKRPRKRLHLNVSMSYNVLLLSHLRSYKI